MIDFGQYRDDGIGENNPMSGPKIEQTKTKIIKVMKELGLAITITIQFCLKTVDF